MNLRLVNAGIVNVVGDSHVEVTFRGLIAHDEATDRYWETETVYVQNMRACEFIKNGELLPVIHLHLTGQHILRATKRDDSGWDLDANPRGGIRPTLFVCGDQDLRNILLPQLVQYDYLIPWRDQSAQPPLEPNLSVAAFDKIDVFARKLLMPYVQGLVLLRRIGVKQPYALSIAPPSPDDDIFEKFNGIRISRAQRYRGALLMNDVLRQLCANVGIEFIDIWDRVTVDGLLDKRYELDGTHLSKEAGLLALSQMLA